MQGSSWIRQVVGVVAVASVGAGVVVAQDAAKPATVRQSGTVKSVEGGTITLQNAAGTTYTVQVATPARVVQLAPGSTDLKTASPTTVDQITAGDRILVAGKAGDGNAITATQVVVMKSGDIAARNQQIQADWQKRGSGGIVSGVDAATGTITIKSGAKSIAVHTSPQTIYKRYAPGSVKYEEAVAGRISQIAVGDQLQVRGDKSEDGTSINAEEVVSGSFQNLSGLIASIDQGAQTFTIKDLATKKTVTVHVTGQTDLRNLPPEMGTRIAARLKGGAASGAAGGARPQGEGAPAGARSGPPAGGEGAGPRGPRGEFSLAQMLTHLPTATVSDLKQGEALMIVASQGEPSQPVTAITILAGVEPLLAAASAGSQGMTLSPWSLGGAPGGDAAGMQ